MIRGLQDTKRIAESILKLSSGDCEICGLPIGEEYCVPAQIFPVDMEGEHTIDLHYEVACSECYRQLRALLDARRSLKAEE